MADNFPGDDPINRPGFNPHIYREPNATTISELRQLARTWRAAKDAADGIRRDLDAAVVEAKAAGHSFQQIREATGFGIASIQIILAKARKEEVGARELNPPD